MLASVVTWCMFLLAIFLIFLIFNLDALPSPRRYFLAQKLPGPPGIFYFGNGLQLACLPFSGVMEWLEKEQQKQERLMKIWLLGVSSIYLKKPHDIQVLLSSATHIKKGVEYNWTRPWLNNGLLTSAGLKWHERRKLLTPTFHFKVLEDSMSILNRNSLCFAEKLSKTGGQPVCIEPYITRCTLDAISEAAMGIQLNSQSDIENKYCKNVMRITELIMERALKPWLSKDWIFYLSSEGREFTKVLKYLHGFTENVIKERKEVVFSKNTEKIDSSRHKRRKAFLDLLLEEERLHPGTLSDLDIREEVDTFMFEGHDTVSSAINFLLFNLGSHPEIQGKVYKEIYDIFGDSEREITLKDLTKMTYMDKTIKESLRMFPSAPYFSRGIEEDLILDGGLILPAQANIVVMPYIVHRNPEVFPDPEKFDPERFSDDQVVNRHPFAYIPFSAGPRNCIGQKFAMMEIKTTIAWILRKLRIKTITKREGFNLVLSLVLRTDAPIKCEFVPRHLDDPSI